MQKILFFIFIGYAVQGLANFGQFAFFKTSGTSVTCPGGWLDSNNLCWVKSTAGGNCDTACSGLGGCGLLATRYLTGSSGSNSACQTVMDGLVMAGSGAPTTLASTVGCAVHSTPTRRRGTSTTTCAATSAGYTRACSCLQTGTSCYVPGYGTVAHGSCIDPVYTQSDATCGDPCAAFAVSSCCSNGTMDQGVNMTCNEWPGLPC